MPLLTRKKNITDTPSSAQHMPDKARATMSLGKNISTERAPKAGLATGNLALVRPRITEKATHAAEAHVYTFAVELSATKTDIAQAVRSLYGVTPRLVRTAHVIAKKRFSRGKQGKTARAKKAYVYLKEGDTIEFV